MTSGFFGGNRITLLRSGGEYFPALLAAFAAARQEIHLETYLYEDDATGSRITAALCDAALRGVVVHLLVDGFGAKDMPASLVRHLLDGGVQLLVYRPKISPLTLRRHRLRRLHRKVTVIDGRMAFVGGINIIDDAHTPGRVPPRHDYAVQVEGPLVRPIHTSAMQLWRRVAWARLERGPEPSAIVVDDHSKGTQRAAFVTRDNLIHRTDIEDFYLAAIASAREEVIIASAYFFPGRRFRRALSEAAGRGARVILLLQGSVEFVLLHYASRALYGTLLEAGVEIREYHKGFLHAKVAVIDGRWATVGSSNLDPFSLMLAREANVVVEDREFAAELRQSLHETMSAGAVAVRPARWFHQPLWRRVAIWISYGIVRFLMGMVGYGGQA